MIRAGAILLVAVLMAACEKEEYISPEDQPVYFEYRYVNYAWGYQEHGWLIDHDGYVRYFEKPDSFRVPDPSGYISIEDLEYNLGQTDSIIGQVAENKLTGYVNNIPGAASGEIGKSDNIAADAGSSVLTCYLYDEERESYLKVFLAASGDWEQFNLSGEAEILVDWLKQYDVFWLSE